MHRAPAVDIVLGPSRLACAWIALVAAFTLAAFITLPVNAWASVGVGAALLAWARQRIHAVALRDAPASVRQLRVEGDWTVRIVARNGVVSRGRVLPGTYVGARLTTVVWQRDGARWARAEWVLPDMLVPEDFRRLRVQLRYLRSDSVAGRRASHA